MQNDNAREPLKNVGEAASARQKQAKKRSLHAVNEHFEPVFNEALATQVVFQRFLPLMWGYDNMKHLMKATLLTVCSLFAVASFASDGWLKTIKEFELGDHRGATHTMDD